MTHFPNTLKFLLILAAMTAFFFLRSYWDGRNIEKESAGFAEQAVGAVSSGWTEAEFKKVQDPYQNTFLVNGAQKGDLGKTLPSYAKLGRCVTPVSCTMEDFTTYKADRENYVAANYLCSLRCEKAAAAVTLSVRRFTVAGGWKLTYFDVQSPYLAKQP